MSNVLKYDYTGIKYGCNNHGNPDAFTVGRVGRLWLNCCWAEHLKTTGNVYCKECDKEFPVDTETCPECGGKLMMEKELWWG